MTENRIVNWVSGASRFAVAGLLAAAVAVPSGLMASNAYAEDGTVTITQQANADATYDAYRVFKADIDSTNNKATHVTWENDAVKTAVENFIKQHAGTTEVPEVLYTQDDVDAWIAENPSADPSECPFAVDDVKTPASTVQNYTGTTAQEAAEYISSQIAASTGVNSPTWVDGGSFADKLAEAVSAVSSAKVGTAASGEEFTGPEGYYLFVTTPSTIGANEMGTAPIWFPLGGTADEINEKASKPVLKKEVKEDSGGKSVTSYEAVTTINEGDSVNGLYEEGAEAGTYVATSDTEAQAGKTYYEQVTTTGSEWGATADAEIEQLVDFRLTLTMPGNLNTLEYFKGTFTDTLPAGMTVDTDSVVVTVDGVDVTEGQAASGDDPAVDAPTVSFANSVLTVSHANWKLFNSAANGKDIVVTYKAKLTGENVVYGNDGNKNTCVFEYTNNPNVDGTGDPKGTTNETEAKVFVYCATVDKFDKATEAPLPGAKFVIKNQEGKYLTDTGWDGAAEADAKKFVTGADGSIDIYGLDEGTYTLTEVEAPANYTIPEANKNITIVVTSELPDTAADTDDVVLTATVSGGLEAALVNVDSDEGNIELKQYNDKELTLAMTGAEGVGLAGVVVLALGATALLITKRHNRKADAEE